MAWVLISYLITSLPTNNNNSLSSSLHFGFLNLTISFPTIQLFLYNLYLFLPRIRLFFFTKNFAKKFISHILQVGTSCSFLIFTAIIYSKSLAGEKYIICIFQNIHTMAAFIVLYNYDQLPAISFIIQHSYLTTEHFLPNQN